MRKCTKNYKRIIFLACTKNIISKQYTFFWLPEQIFLRTVQFFGVQYNFFGDFYFHCWFVCVCNKYILVQPAAVKNLTWELYHISFLKVGPNR